MKHNSHYRTLANNSATTTGVKFNLFLYIVFWLSQDRHALISTSPLKQAPPVTPRSRDERQELLALKEAHQRALTENQILTERYNSIQQQLQDTLKGNEELRALLKDLQAKLDIILTQTKKRNRTDYGKKNERHNPRQAPEAPSDDENSDLPPTAPASSVKPAKNKNHKKNIHIQDLPIKPVPHPVSAQDSICPKCIIPTTFVRNELTYQLERLSSSLMKLEHQQEVRACPKCKTYIVTAEKPCPPLPGGLAGPCLLGSIIVSKFADALPNFRQAKIFRREHGRIPRSTQCDWVIDSARLLEPLWDLMKREVLSSKVIKTDDTGIKIQDRKHRNKIRKGKMTPYIGDKEHNFAVFDFSPDLSFARNKLFLEEFIGLVQCDAAGGFDALFKDGSKIEVGCRTHDRRHYFDAKFVHQTICEEILDIYSALYDIEEAIKDKTSAERLAQRQLKSKPLVAELHQKILAMKGTKPPSDLLMKAVEYSLNHWIALCRFLDDPDLDIDNNDSERTIKDFVLDRKNFLFVGSDAGGRAAAIHLSFMASCKRNDVNPLEYLTDVFTRINTMKTSELHQLLPDRWKPT